MSIPFPANETLRLCALRETGLLYTPRLRAFDEIACLAADVCDMPMAMVSLIDAESGFVKARVGLEADAMERGTAFCAFTILRDEPFVVPDAAADPRFAQAPLETPRGRVRFYAGAPLLTAEGFALGALAVMDTKPGALTDCARSALVSLARVCAELMEMHRRLRQVERSYRASLDEMNVVPAPASVRPTLRAA